MCGLRGKEGQWLETKVLELGCLGSKPTSALTLSSHAAIFCLQSEEDIFSHTEDLGGTDNRLHQDTRSPSGKGSRNVSFMHSRI